MIELKESAKNLIEKFWHLDEECEIEDGFKFGCKCALICIDEIIKTKPTMPKKYTGSIGYWLEVKKEIEKYLMGIEDNEEIKNPIDKVTIDNLDAALKICNIQLDKKVIDIIIDLVELIENKGDKVSIFDIIMIKNLIK